MMPTISLKAKLASVRVMRPETPIAHTTSGLQYASGTTKEAKRKESEIRTYICLCKIVLTNPARK
jgi:hypothetical protein